MQLGADRLDLGYHPNKTFGTPRPLHYALYEAASKNEVQFDPRWTLPVIKAIEKIPDEQYRELLRPVASLSGRARCHFAMSNCTFISSFTFTAPPAIRMGSMPKSRCLIGTSPR